ncbi:hypothetical protein BKA56DRAFT_617938 [Ilyonectria sp. MPI-CAGE-AT-0026]|nr:hypothetical protein BKA56DRAFT_617938 [Ilyonectria sp. MPI-CAGE-AT-0026]
MPLLNYGVWKAKPTAIEVERDDDKPHAQLEFEDGGEMKLRAAINVKSSDSQDSKLVYWLIKDFQHPIRDKLKALTIGWHDMCLGSSHERISLDLLRDSLVNLDTGVLAPHSLPGPNNDVSDAIELFFQDIERKASTVYVFGERFFNWDKNEEGVHDVHMNQGSRGGFRKANAINQDGGLILEFPDGHWEAFLTAFASQTEKTDPRGNPMGKTLGELLGGTPPPATPDIAIAAAIINAAGQDGVDNPEEVHLRNKSGAAVSVAGWRIENKAGNHFTLPDTALLAANGGRLGFKIGGVPLGNKGGTIILKNKSLQQVDSVTYSQDQVGRDGELVDFGRDRATLVG